MPASSQTYPIPQDVAVFDLDACRDRFRIVALGDSTTECNNETAPMTAQQRWTSILESLIGPWCKVVNAGIGHTTSGYAVYRWHREVSPTQPHCVVISFLLNDSHIRDYECPSSYVVACTPDRMYSNLQTMVEWSRAMGASPVFWTPPPVPRWPEAFFKNLDHLDIQLEILDLYLLTVERVARDLDVPLVDFWRTFPDLVEEYPGPYFNPPDNYHSNARSQAILAEGIEQVIRPVFDSWSRRSGR